MHIGLEAHRNVKLSPHLIQGTFIARLNRFAALVKVCGRDVQVHVANSGRLRELLQPGMGVLLTPVGDTAHRKTTYDLSLVDLDHTLVSADARLPSTLVYEALSESRLPQLAGYDTILREQVLEDSRLDLLLLGAAGKCYVEVKSVTLVEEETGLFPNAPTSRGRRHVETLGRAVRQGCRAAVLFVIQREDVQAFHPNDVADPAFGVALRLAYTAGVEIYAYRCHMTLQEVRLHDQVPVLLFPQTNAP